MAVDAPVVLPPHLRKKTQDTAAASRDTSTSTATSADLSASLVKSRTTPIGHHVRSGLPAPPVATSKSVLEFDGDLAALTDGLSLNSQPQSQESSPSQESLRSQDTSEQQETSQQPRPNPPPYIKTPPLLLQERLRLKQLLHDFLQRFDNDHHNLRSTPPEDFYAVLPESLIKRFDIARSRIGTLQSRGQLAAPKADQKNVPPPFLLELIAVQNELDGVPGIAFLMPVWPIKRMAHAIIMKDMHGFDRALLVCLMEQDVCRVCKGVLPFASRATVLGCKNRCVVHEDCVDIGSYADAVGKCPVCQVDGLENGESDDDKAKASEHDENTSGNGERDRDQVEETEC